MTTTAWVGTGARYHLVERVTDGGEGEIWRAVSHTGADETHHWAVKILPADRDAEEWSRRWEAARQRTSQRPLPFLVLPSDVFRGPPPFVGRRSVDRHRDVVFMVSRWIDGAVDLERWCAGDPTLDERCRLVARLCDAVDDLGRAGFVHCDLSPRNVMLEDGEVRLIDLTFLARTGAPGEQAPAGTPGFGAPENRHATTVDPARDRYSVGALAYYLLVGDAPPRSPHDVRHHLTAKGHSDGLADHLLALLASDPAARPADLREWAVGLRRRALAGEQVAVHTDLAIAVDGAQVVHTMVSGRHGVEATAATPGRGPALRPLAGAGPGPVASIALARRGNGEVVAAAVDVDGVLHLRHHGSWQRVDTGPLAGRVVATATGDGSVVCFAGARSGRTVEVTLRLRGQPKVRQLPGGTGRPVAVATGPGGTPVLVTATRDGRVLGGAPDAQRATKLADVDLVAVTVNPFHEAVYAAGRTGEPGLRWIGPSGELEYLPTPAPVRDVALLWSRTGPLLAVATDAGVLHAPGPTGGRRDPDDGDRWRPLGTDPARRVVLCMVNGWLIHLAALTDAGVAFAEEWAVDDWHPLSYPDD